MALWGEWAAAQRFMPPTPVTRVAAGSLVLATLPFAVCAARVAPRVRWGNDESRLLWATVAVPGALTVGAVGTLATGQARYLLPSIGVTAFLAISVYDRLAGHPWSAGTRPTLVGRR